MFSGVFANFFKEEPPFSLSRSYSYPDQRKTANLQVPYFTGSGFAKKVREHNFLKNLEFDIETQYVNKLRGEC
jgi:hypothetical protein